MQSCCCFVFCTSKPIVSFLLLFAVAIAKLPIVVIQKFFYHGSVTSLFRSLLNCNLFTHGFKRIRVFQIELKFEERGKTDDEPGEKNFPSKGESKQQTQPTSWRRRQDAWVLSPLRYPPLPIKSIKTINSIACKQTFGGLSGEVTREPHAKGDAIVKGEERKRLRCWLARFLAACLS